MFRIGGIELPLRASEIEGRPSFNISVDQVAAAFDLEEARLKGGPRQGGGHLMFLIEARQGKFALIRSRPRSDDDATTQEGVRRKLERQNLLVTYLAGKGFPVAPPLLTRDGLSLLSIGGIVHTLHPYVEGRHMEGDNRRHLSAVAAALASYHRLTCEYPHANEWPKEHYPRLFHEKLVRFDKDIEVLEPLAFELGISRSLRFFKTALPGVEQRLRSLPYEDLPKAVIHNDIRCENVLFAGDKLVALLDFAHSVYGPRVLDLATALSNLVSTNDNKMFVESSRKFMTSYNNKDGVHLTTSEGESLPILIEARIVWKALRKVRKMALKDANRHRRARKFHKYAQRLRWLEDHWSVWQGAFF